MTVVVSSNRHQFFKLDGSWDLETRIGGLGLVIFIKRLVFTPRLTVGREPIAFSHVVNLWSRMSSWLNYSSLRGAPCIGLRRRILNACPISSVLVLTAHDSCGHTIDNCECQTVFLKMCGFCWVRKTSAWDGSTFLVGEPSWLMFSAFRNLSCRSLPGSNNSFFCVLRWSHRCMWI